MTRTEPQPGGGGDDSAIRLDKWLHYARFFKTRGQAAEVIGKKRVRVNGQPVSRPGRQVAPGDVLTLRQGQRIRVIRILAPGTRRGPASEAQMLYLDLDAGPTPPAGPEPTEQGDP